MMLGANSLDPTMDRLTRMLDDLAKQQEAVVYLVAREIYSGPVMLKWSAEMDALTWDVIPLDEFYATPNPSTATPSPRPRGRGRLSTVAIPIDIIKPPVQLVSGTE